MVKTKVKLVSAKVTYRDYSPGSYINWANINICDKKRNIGDLIEEAVGWKYADWAHFIFICDGEPNIEFHMIITCAVFWDMEIKESCFESPVFGKISNLIECYWDDDDCDYHKYPSLRIKATDGVYGEIIPQFTLGEIEAMGIAAIKNAIKDWRCAYKIPVYF